MTNETPGELNRKKWDKLQVGGWKRGTTGGWMGGRGGPLVGGWVEEGRWGEREKGR